MGSPATRITRDEFLTPPEFRGLDFRGHPAGRVGGARIELIREGEATRLGTCYQQIPTRLMPPFALDGEPASLLYLITLTAGLMDGDGHLIELNARAGSRAVVTGQSATRIHPALASHATQQWNVALEDDACLVILPGPAIPFRGSRYYQRGRVELAPRSRLIWGDIWLSGRYDRGELSERFQFERIIQDFEVRRAGRLIYRDRFRWDGPWSPEQVGWYLGGELASASLLVTDAATLPPPLTTPTLRRAVFPIDEGLACLRWCGHPLEVTTDLVRVALGLAGSWTSTEGTPWLLGSSGLAPNHWFSILETKSGSEADRPANPVPDVPTLVAEPGSP